MHKIAFQGLGYIIIRFKKIDFDIILLFIKKFIILEEICVYIYAESLLADIAIMIPELKGKVIPYLKNKITVLKKDTSLKSLNIILLYNFTF